MKNIHLFVTILMAVLSAITGATCLYFAYTEQPLGFYIGLGEFVPFTIFGILAGTQYKSSKVK
jgi:nicotinamide riboside transporter PnuC